MKIKGRSLFGIASGALFATQTMAQPAEPVVAGSAFDCQRGNA